MPTVLLNKILDKNALKIISDFFGIGPFIIQNVENEQNELH